MTLRRLEPWERPDQEPGQTYGETNDHYLMAVARTLRGNGIELILTTEAVTDIVALLSQTTFGRAAMAGAVSGHLRETHDAAVLGAAIARALEDATL